MFEKEDRQEEVILEGEEKKELQEFPLSLSSQDQFDQLYLSNSYRVEIFF